MVSSDAALERRTDGFLQVGRDKADAEQVVMREQSDAARVFGSQTLEETLRFERHRSDAALSHERAGADGALTLERSSRRNAEATLFSNERTNADLNLAEERGVTDVDLAGAAGLLATEMSSHSTTKVALATREELVAIVSHDLRNPLGVVATCANMLLEDAVTARLDEETKSWLTFIKRNADIALRLVNDLLDMERMSQGKVVLMRVRTNLTKLVNDTVNDHIGAAEEKAIFLRIVNTGKPVETFCDPDRISQVVSNLIGNAVKFSEEGGNVSVEVTAEGASGARVSVRDDGKGIAPEKLGSVFDRFSQINDRDRQGLGLGLYISKAIIGAHGGTIRVESALGKGSTFTFSLPSTAAH